MQSKLNFTPTKTAPEEPVEQEPSTEETKETKEPSETKENKDIKDVEKVPSPEPAITFIEIDDIIDDPKGVKLREGRTL